MIIFTFCGYIFKTLFYANLCEVQFFSSELDAVFLVKRIEKK